MNTRDVAALFRTYCDEPDESFLSTADVALYCKLGYAQFLAFIDDNNPYVRLRGTVITLANARTYDLGQGGILDTAVGTPSILGPNPNIINNAGNFNELPRMTRLVAIYSQNAVSQLPIMQYNIVNNLNAILPNGMPNTVQWSGQQLTFATNQSASLMLLYNYEQDVGLTLANPPPGVPAGQPGQSWLTTAGAIINTVLDDDMNQWHDMIPLFAYAQYAIADAATSPQVMSRLLERKAELREYLIQRSFGAASHVHYNADPSEFF